ncbi:MAG: YeeE/YedE family protein [Gammaproteobacteria bacterium]|nr:YeeE/YedE family protein [Gammaproteobacteria bacterium]
MSVAKPLTSLLAGIIFGLGLAISGLANPDKVLQFLTLNSDWSPALLFTMGAGIVVTFFGYKWVLQRGPVLAEAFSLPTNTRLDPQLLTGAGIFGIGWGLAGFCPGPALVGLTSGMIEPVIFVIALIAGSQLRKITA